MDVLLSLPALLLGNLLANADLVLLLGAYYGASQMMQRKAGGHGLDQAAVGDLTLWVAIGAVVAGRIAYVVSTGGLSVIGLRGLLLINTGMNLYGAIAGGFLLGWLYSRRRSLPSGVAADLFGLFIPLVIAVQRFGCLLDNACYGRQMPAPFGIQFAGLAQPRFPSDLYEGLLTLLLFAGLLWFSSRAVRPAGTLLAGFLVGYPLIRAAIDMTRISVGGMERTFDPLLSIAIATAAGAWLCRSMWRARRSPAGDRIAVQARPVARRRRIHPGSGAK
jgi:prolipoprotein diacylglyceryltransferase